ncbi:hypothetical protein KCU77_g1390, partial [Aureobasidium melanogenum]
MMDNANNLPQTEDSTMNGLGSPSVNRSEVVAQKDTQSRLAQSLKNYQDESPEVATILQQWQEIENKYTQMINEKGQLIPECKSLLTTIMLNNAFHIATIQRVPPSSDLDILSVEQLQSLQWALYHDQNARKAISILYEKHKKIHDTCNAFEELINFREEQFVLEPHQQQDMDNGKTSIAETRQFIRDSAALLITISQ